MNSRTLFYGSAVLPCLLSLAGLSAQTIFTVLAAKPPSLEQLDTFGPSAGENEVRASADVMATKLKSGWRYALADIEWYHPDAHKRIYFPWTRDYGQLACERAF